MYLRIHKKLEDYEENATQFTIIEYPKILYEPLKV